MKGNAFSDRVRLVTEWFQSWNNCEQTIALYSLLSKVSPTQAHFLSLVLDHSLLNGFKSPELIQLEKEANNASFLSSLHSQTEEAALAQLLSHLPLLNPSSTEARAEYMKLLPKVMLGSSEELDYLDQCRQLLSLALVHPAFPLEDREALTYWFSQLDRKQHNIVERKLPSPPTSRMLIKSSPEDWNQSGRINISGDLRALGESEGFSGDEESPPLNKSSSLPASGLHHTPSSVEVEESSVSYEEYLMKHIGRMGHIGGGSLPAPPVPVEVLDNTVWKDGMEDVPMWLKSLRLHKYQSLFAEMEYEQMLSMTEDYLSERGVTKGARTKIILSIRKLARRPETLVEIEQDMEKAGRLISCIQELRQMLLTPIKPYSSGGKPEPAPTPDDDKQQQSSDSELEELLAKDFPHEDLPSLITRAMAKGFSQLMGYTDTNEENLSAFIKLLDSALTLTHKVFTNEQKQLIFEWKQQCTQNLRMMSPKKSTRGRNLVGFHTIGSVPSSRVSSKPSRSLRGGRVGPGSRTLTLPAFPRSSSTLPRMSPRQLQQAPLPTSAFRPKSLLANGKFPLGAGYSATPPVPPRSTPVDSGDYTNDLPQRVAEKALDEPPEA